MRRHAKDVRPGWPPIDATEPSIKQMTSRTGQEALLQQLSDGRFHSGQRLAALLGVSRTAVWKRLQRMQAELGIEVQSVRGRGYRLAAPLELLNEAAIRQHLSSSAGARVEELLLCSVVDSTNNAAAASDAPQPGRAKVWLAEHQTAGRGRRGRQWVSVFGSNLYLSLAWQFERALSELAGLSLATGVIVAEMLAANRVDGLVLKWPNDVLVDGRKVCGILVEISGETAGPATAVIGIGLNLRLSRNAAEQIDQPWTDLSRLGVSTLSRNRLAARLVEGLVSACTTFEACQLAPFIERWQAFDGLQDKPVSILHGPNTVDGIYRGIAPNGAVRVETPAGVTEHLAGEVSLRAVVS